VSIAPAEPGRYRIRREPSDQHLATIEATALALGVIEGDVEAYRALLRPFDAMVDGQLERAATARGTRHQSRAARRTKPSARFDELAPILAAPTRAVVVYAEVNSAPTGSRHDGVPELVHVVAVRPFVDGAAIDLVTRPRAAVHDATLARLGLARAAVDGGLDGPSATAAIDAFIGDGKVLCWGAFPRDAIASAGAVRRGFIDLRALCCRLLGGSAGGLDVAARRLGAPAPLPSTPRAVRMASDAVFIARALTDAAQRRPDA